MVWVTGCARPACHGSAAVGRTRSFISSQARTSLQTQKKPVPFISAARGSRVGADGWPRQSRTPQRGLGRGAGVRWEQPRGAQKPPVSSAREEMSVGCPPAPAAGGGRSAGSCPRRGSTGCPAARRVPGGWGKATAPGAGHLWGPAALGEGIGVRRNFWTGFVFSSSRSLQTRPSAHLGSAGSAVPGEGGGQGATTLRKKLCCRAQPLNSATPREPHTCFTDLSLAPESSSETPGLHTPNTSVHPRELPGCSLPPARAGSGPCRELPRFWVVVAEAGVQRVPSTASTVGDARCVAGWRRLCGRITVFIFVVHFMPSSFSTAFELHVMLGCSWAQRGLQITWGR